MHELTKNLIHNGTDRWDKIITGYLKERAEEIARDGGKDCLRMTTAILGLTPKTLEGKFEEYIHERKEQRSYFSAKELAEIAKEHYGNT